jgi:replicative DNA helicase
MIETERAILSSMIFDPSLWLTLDEEIFVNQSTRNIYRAMASLRNKSLPLDEIFIFKELKKSHSEETIQEMLIPILSTSPLSTIAAYVNILNEQHQKRDIEQLLIDIRINLNDEKIDTAQARTQLRTKLDKIEANQHVELFDAFTPSEIEEADTEYYLKTWLPIPKESVALITAPGGVGKTFLVIQMAMRIALEEKKRIFLWLSEDKLSKTKKRMQMIAKEILKTDIAYFDKYITITNSAPFHFINKPNSYSSEHNSKFYDLKRLLDAYDIVFFDPLIAFYGGIENDNADARFFMQPLTQWCEERNTTICLIHHSPKGTIGSRGGGAFVDAVRLHYGIDNILDENDEHIQKESRNVHVLKDNDDVLQFLKKDVVSRQLFPSQNRNPIPVEIVEFPHI